LTKLPNNIQLYLEEHLGGIIMKKILSILLCSLLLFTIVGCGSSAKKYTAEEYGNKLKDAGVTIENMEVTTTENDKNQLLGRPNQYTSKVTFTNGSIEVFANKEDATNRKEYIDNIGKKMPLVAEYNYVNDTGALLRLDKKLNPDEAKKYEDAFMKIK
jgi:uncharacterized lipoprotein YehR (DUF1307 family)